MLLYGCTLITWNFDDGNGNDIDVTQNVVIDDITAPVTPTLADVTGECTATATAPTTTDACAGTITGTTSDALTYTTQGTHVITWNFDDGNGNNIDVTQNVVIDDVTDPTTPTLADVTGECTATATAPTTTDNCAGTVTGTTSDALTYTTQGTHVITWNFDDGNGNDIDVTQIVVIDDITAPVTPTLADVTGECTATATAPTTTDACAGTVTGTTSDALTYSTQGTHVITWNFDDGNGNDIDVTQNVVIEDITAPTPDVEPLMELTGECSVDDPGTPTGTDNCGGMVTVTTGTIFPTGSDIIWTYEDENGNTYTQTQTVTLEDLTAPVPDIANLPDLTEECSIDLSTYSVTATDNCAGTVNGTTPQTIFDTQGTYSITWTYEDLAGNTYSQTQTIIIEDLTAPETPTLTDVTGKCSATATAPTTTDNCAGTITGTTSDLLEYTEQGTFVTTWNFDDGNGNSFDVTQNVIVEDITDPTITCPADQTIDLNEGETFYTVLGTEFDATTEDNCDGVTIETTSIQLQLSMQLNSQLVKTQLLGQQQILPEMKLLVALWLL